MSYERANVRRMAGYVYGEQPNDTRVVKLNTNENAYPPSPAVGAALARFDAATLRRYPQAGADPLREQIAERFGLHREQVVATNGGDEALRLALATFVDPGAVLGIAEPSYSLLPVLAAVQDCAVATVSLSADWKPPAGFAARLNAAGAKLTCIVNPHAPSGVLIDGGVVAALAAELDGVLLVDEAYVDFVDPDRGHDLTPLLAAHDNLLLLRTLSKGYALAGLRVGFLLGSAGLVAPIRVKTRDSYNVDAVAQALAAAAFADVDYAENRWRAIRSERRRLSDALRALGFAVPASQTNFVLAGARTLPAPASTAARLVQRLRERNVLVRHFDAPRLADCLRVTVGTPKENDALLDALRTEVRH